MTVPILDGSYENFFDEDAKEANEEKKRGRKRGGGRR